MLNYICSMLFRKIGLIVLLCLGLKLTYAQNNTVYRDSKTLGIPYALSSGEDLNSVITNYFVNEIALSNQKKPEFIKYVFSGTQLCRIIETSAGKFDAGFELTDLVNTGDVGYKSFSISDVLIPSTCSFNFQVYGSQSTPISSQTIAEAPLKPGYNKLADYTFADTSKAKKFSIVLDNLKFNYDTTAKSRFSKRLKLIDDYFSSETLLNQYMSQLKTIDFSNTDMIIVYDIRLKDLEKASDELYKLDFPGKLHLVSHDPIHFIDRYDNFSDTLILIRNQMNGKLSSLDKIYFDKGMGELQHKETDKAQLYFKKSILFNPAYAPSHLELAKIQYRRDSLLAASDKIAYILQKLNPEPAVQKQVLLYADTVYTKMVAEGNEDVRTEKFNEAVELFEQCTKFCSGLPGYTCNEDHTRGLASAKFGIYQSYLTVSQQALDNGKLEIAEIYITAAQSYQKTNFKEIISDAEAKLKFEKLIKAYIAKADTLSSRQKFDKALMFLGKAQNIGKNNDIALPEKFSKSITKAKNGIYKEKLKISAQELKLGDADEAEKVLNDAVKYQCDNSETVNILSTADSILLKIKAAQYKNYITDAMPDLAIQNYKMALNGFDNAKKLERVFLFKPYPALDSLIRSAAKPVVEQQIDRAKSLLALNLVDSAKALVVKIKNLQNSHLLAGDTLLNHSFDNLSALIYKARCTNAHNSFDSACIQANIAANLQNYLKASELYSAAIKISEKYPDCSIDASAAITDKKANKPATDYQLMLQKADLALEQLNYPEYFFFYYEAEVFFANNAVKNFGLVHHLLVDMVGVSSNPAFVSVAFDFFISKNRPDDALVCLKTLKKMQYPVEKTKGLQQQLGIKLALRDFAYNKSLSPAMMVVSYTAADKWFRDLKNAYNTTWKSMK